MTYGRLTIIGSASPDPSGYKRVMAKCECGIEKPIRLAHLVSGRVSSCGSCGRLKHGCARIRTPEYNAWISMTQRCRNPNNPRWKDYGGRGIRVCRRWQRSFAAFLFDLGLRPSPEHSIDRRDNDKGYNKQNCRWATRSEQQSNRRVCRRAA